MASLAEIYDWFMTGKKPTQAQFWASWGSFWNKGEQIPQSSISGLPGVLNAKAEKTQFDAHKTDDNAHPILLQKARIIPVGKLLFFKRDMTTPDAPAATDIVMGIVEGVFINGTYLGGDVNLLASYDIVTQF